MAEKDERMIAALLRERDAYVRQDKPDRVAQVDEELLRHGYEPEPEPEPSADVPQGRTGSDGTQQTADATPPAASDPGAAAAAPEAETAGTAPAAASTETAKKTTAARGRAKS